MAHGTPVAIPTFASDRFALDPEKIEKAVTPATKAILLNFPCNPTGATLTLEQTEAIADIAKKHDLLVLADHIYSELTYGPMTPSIATLPGMRDRTIFLHGFSKAFAMTGFRIGYACGPADIIDSMMKIHQYSMLCAPVMAQEAAEDAILSARNDMEAMRAEYRLRRNYIVKRLNGMGLKCLMPEGAFYAFADIRSTGLSAPDFAMKLLESEKVAVVPGGAFGPSGEGYIRCSYATSLDRIRTAMDRMERFVSSLSGKVEKRIGRKTKTRSKNK